MAPAVVVRVSFVELVVDAGVLTVANPSGVTEEDTEVPDQTCISVLGGPSFERHEQPVARMALGYD